MRRDELYHYGVRGMKWRFRKAGRKELGEEVLGEKSPNNPVDFNKSIQRTKNSRASYRTGRVYDPADGSRSMAYHLTYRKRIRNKKTGRNVSKKF